MKFYPDDWYKDIKNSDYNSLKRSMRKYYGTFRIPKTITKIKFDQEQRKIVPFIHRNCVIKTYIKPLDFFNFSTTHGLDIAHWLDINALTEKLDKLKNGVLLDTPVIKWDGVHSKNMAHEGRHRCVAYDIAGVRKIPILVVITHNGIGVDIGKADKRILNRFKPYSVYKRDE